MVTKIKVTGNFSELFRVFEETLRAQGVKKEFYPAMEFADGLTQQLCDKGFELTVDIDEKTGAANVLALDGRPVLSEKTTDCQRNSCGHWATCNHARPCILDEVRNA